MSKAVEMRGITKRFPGVIANDDITFSVEKQEIHCLLGENGSGKTTLMNVLFGMSRKDSGEIFINGEKVNISSPADAEKLGIGMVHQHFMLVNQYTVWENVIMGSEPGRFFIDRAAAREEVKEIVARYHFNLEIDRKVADLSVGMRQRVEIVKLLFRGAQIIIFDEPTAVLTPQEAEELFNIFRLLQGQGCTIIFITHKMHEIFEISQSVTVLRKGRVIGTDKTAFVTPQKLSEMMVGREIEEVRVEIKGSSLGEIILKVQNLSLLPKKDGKVDFSVHSGEIVGVAGIDGNGQMELEELLVGTRTIKDGAVTLYGSDLKKMSVRERKALGFAYIPSDRAKSGALPLASIRDNFLLGHQDAKRYRCGPFIKGKQLDEDGKELVREYDIRVPSVSVQFDTLSGGNQQKVVLAREVSKPTKFVLAAQPARGLDIGASEYIYKTLLRLRSQGDAILLISAELSELINLSDRIIVLYEGRITGEFNRGEFSEQRIGLAMAGIEQKLEAAVGQK